MKQPAGSASYRVAMAGLLLAFALTPIGALSQQPASPSTTGALSRITGQMLAPGPLSEAHAKLEGIGNCTRCHEPVTSEQKGATPASS